LVATACGAVTAQTPRRPNGAGGAEESERGSNAQVVAEQHMLAVQAKSSEKVSNLMAHLARSGSSMDRAKSRAGDS
jgi:hypothetical protein